LIFYIKGFDSSKDSPFGVLQYAYMKSVPSLGEGLLTSAAWEHNPQHHNMKSASCFW
jgi:hypothetical protein